MGIIIFMLVIDGIFYVEVCDLVNNCLSECIVFMIIINFNLIFVVNNVVCVVDLFIYVVDI